MPTFRLLRSVEERKSGGAGMVGNLWGENEQPQEVRQGKQLPKVSSPQLLKRKLLNFLPEEANRKEKHISHLLTS